MKEKLKKWFQEQSKFSKITLLIVFILNIVIAVYKTPFYIFSQYGPGIFLNAMIRYLISAITFYLLISVVVSLIPYLIFRKNKNIKYLDYFAITFLVISCYFSYFN